MHLDIKKTSGKLTSHKEIKQTKSLGDTDKAAEVCYIFHLHKKFKQWHITINRLYRKRFKTSIERIHTKFISREKYLQCLYV